jgi:membrane protein DedA with SNARE-associated domain
MIAAALASSPPPLPGFLNALSGTLQHYGLWAIGLLITLEDFGIPVPGETILIAGAIFAGAGRINVVALGAVAFVAAVIGDNIGFAIGHFGGRALALRFGKYVFLTEERLNKAEAFFDRRGSIVITFARFVEGLRQANGIIAGITGMHWLRFVIFNAIGAALWVGTWVTIGYFAGNNITTVYHYITLYSYYVLAGLVVLIVGYIVWHRRRRRRAAASGASETDEAPEASGASEAAEPPPDQHGPAHAVPDEQATEIAPTEHVTGPSVPDRHAPEQPSRRQGS